MRGEHGLVTSVEPQATRAGCRLLEAGGNAADAAVATAFVLAVTHPSAGNLGGGGFALVRARDSATVALDFRETAPAALTRGHFDAMMAADGLGPVSVGVPGSVAGLLLLHERFGRRPRAEVLAPAIELARRGHRVGPRAALTFVWSWPWLRRDPTARATFGRDGKPLPEGAWLVRSDLARTLERILRDGATGFYAGPIAAAIVARLDGAMSVEDLASYRAHERTPVAIDYRGLRVETMPPPSAGGVALVQLLLELQRQRAFELPPGAPSELHLFLEASRRAQAERRLRVIDPDALPPDELARRLAQWTDPDHPLPDTAPVVRDRATPSNELRPAIPEPHPEPEHTTHLSVVDAEGMVVSLTTTLSAGFGARIMVPGTGIVLNNAVASFSTTGDNLPTGGRRTVSSMAPTLVLAASRPVLVLGSPGGDTIPSTVAQVLRNVVDRGMTIDDAVDAPRVHHGFLPDEFRYERQRPIAAETLGALRALGHHVSERRIPLGDANVILVTPNAAYGYADPREGGLALAARPRTVDPAGGAPLR